VTLIAKLAEVKRTRTGWAIRLEKEEAREIGSDWCPLPLTPEATLAAVEAHCRKIGYGGAKVT